MRTTSIAVVGKSQSTAVRWGTYPIRRLFSFREPPNADTSPAVAGMSPSMAFKSVVLPAPLGPTMAIRTAGGTAKSISQRTRFFVVRDGKVFDPDNGVFSVFLHFIPLPAKPWLWYPRYE